MTSKKFRILIVWLGYLKCTFECCHTASYQAKPKYASSLQDVRSQMASYKISKAMLQMLNVSCILSQLYQVMRPLWWDT